MSGSHRVRRELGQVMVLTIGLTAVVLVLVFVVASASAVHLERKRLLALADGAAAAAADAVDEGRYYGSPPESDGLPLTDASVRSAVEEHLAAVPQTEGVRDLTLSRPTGSPDGVTAQVTLAASARPPLVPWPLLPWSEGVPLRVTAAAVAHPR